VPADPADDRCGRVIHDGSPGLTDQLLSAVPRQTDNGWRLSKGKSRRKIDAAVALVMALDRATAKVEEPPHWPIWAFIA
jgi:phage terminase large subunit-like protein